MLLRNCCGSSQLDVNSSVSKRKKSEGRKKEKKYVIHAQRIEKGNGVSNSYLFLFKLVSGRT
jgi:hypothetical protein